MSKGDAINKMNNSNMIYKMSVLFFFFFIIIIFFLLLLFIKISNAIYYQKNKDAIMSPIMVSV